MGSSPRVRSRLPPSPHTAAAGRVRSPRVRSRRRPTNLDLLSNGIISACAEQTHQGLSARTDSTDHLRVCGADCPFGVCILSKLGSSPRVRSRHALILPPQSKGRIISACAEQTKAFCKRPRGTWDHLRVCGADGHGYRRTDIQTGSSPRVRSRRPWEVNAHQPLGIISACAEQTTTRRRRICATWDHLRVCGADSCILLWFGLVGCRGIFDSCTARGRKTTWMPIFGIDALGSRMFLCEISEPSPCAEFWLRLHCVHVR